MEIVTKIGTPLALAALALMLISGLLKAVAKSKRSGPVLKLLVHWVFIVPPGPRHTGQFLLPAGREFWPGGAHRWHGP